MFSIFARIFRVVFSKAALVAALWILVIGGVAVWLYGKNKYNELPDQHKETIAKLADVENAKKTLIRKKTDLQESIAAKKIQLKARAIYAEAKRQRIVKLQQALASLLGFFGREETERELAAEQKELRKAEADVEAFSAEIGSIEAESKTAQEELVGLSGEIDALERLSAEEQKEQQSKVAVSTDVAAVI